MINYGNTMHLYVLILHVIVKVNVPCQTKSHYQVSVNLADLSRPAESTTLFEIQNSERQYHLNTNVERTYGMLRAEVVRIISMHHTATTYQCYSQLDPLSDAKTQYFTQKCRTGRYL